MRAGRLRHLVIIERRTVTRTDAGGYTSSWTTLDRAYADIRPIRGKEFLDAQQIQSDVDHRIFMRWNTQQELTPKDRVRLGTRVFNLVHVINTNERDTMLEILAKEVV